MSCRVSVGLRINEKPGMADVTVRISVREWLTHAQSFKY